MGTMVELAVSTAEFALSDTLEAVPDAEIAIERAAAHGEEWIVPFLCVRTDDFEAFAAALANDASVEGVECLSASDSERLYWMRWSDSPGPIRAVLDADSTVRSAMATDECWRLRILFTDREALADAYDRYRAAQLDFEITESTDSTESVPVGTV